MVKIAKSTLIFSLSLFLLLSVTQVGQAVQIERFTFDKKYNDYASYTDFLADIPGSQFQSDINTWKSGVTASGSGVKESFENYSDPWHTELNDTNVGDFSTSGPSGEGETSSADAGEGPGKLKVQSGDNTHGRYPIDGDKYLDSADNAVVTLDLKENTFRNLFFYITDPSDVEAYTQITAHNGGAPEDVIDYKQKNGSLHFIGISAESGYLSSITWETFKNDNFKADGYELDTDDYSKNDGWGIDNVSTVPEPATLLLLGTGLVGVAGFARRRRLNRS